MSQVDPTQTSVADLCQAAIVECGAVGVGQAALPQDLVDTQARLQWMLQQWARKRWLVYHLVTYAVTSTGAMTYSFGPGGDFDTSRGGINPFDNQFNNQFGPGTIQSQRPPKLESGFVRQITQSQPNQIDYPIEILQAKEDYNRIRLKSLVAGPGYVVYYEPAWNLGLVYVWPVPQAAQYAIYLSVMEQLPYSFTPGPNGTVSQANFSLPYEYYAGMLYNLALRLRPKFQLPTYPGDPLPGLAKDALDVIRGNNIQIARLQMPKELQRMGLYNIFSDTSY